MRINPRLSASRVGRRAAAALAITAGTLAVTAAGAIAAPSITVAPSAGLDLSAANTLTVTGRGFTADAVTQSLGLYAAITATVDGAIYADMASAQYLNSGMPDGPTRLNTDGTFTTTVTANRRFTSGATAIDCAVVQCSVRTWRAHGDPTGTNLLALKPVVFALAAAGTPEVSVDPARDLARDTPTDVSISGTGFDPNTANGIGFYVAYGPKTASYWTQSARVYGAVKWVRPGATPSAGGDVLNPDGSWRTTLTAAPTYTDGDGNTVDCRVTECGILTFAAQGNANRTFDTATTLTFAPPAPTAEVSPTTELNRDTATTVTIRGQNYVYRFGAYVGLTATVDGRVLYGDQSTFRWVRTAAMGARTPEETLSDGAFTTTIAVTPTFTTDDRTVVDCRVTQCAISTWPAHSVPTPQTLYTNAPLTFAAAVVTPPDDRRDGGTTPPPNDRRDGGTTPPPAVIAPKAVSVKGAQKVARNGVATVGTIAIGSQDATLKPYKLTLKIGKKRYAATVVVPKSVKAGKKATVKVKLSKKAIAALKGRSLKVIVKVKVTAGGKATTVSTRATLKGAAVKKKAAKK